MKVKYIGVDDLASDLFESQYQIPHGISYNSYLILDEKIAITDSVDRHYVQTWLENIGKELGEKLPDYLIIHHMEPDHSAGLLSFAAKYPKSLFLCNEQAKAMMEAFFPESGLETRIVLVKDGEQLNLGDSQLTFVFTPFVHWPEVMMSYLDVEKLLFSADAFGKFGVLTHEEPWVDEARRYYIGIVGKYGPQVSTALEKLAKFDIKKIYPLHGPIIEKENLIAALDKYRHWAAYEPEERGVFIGYSSVYGHTAEAVAILKDKLSANGEKNVAIADLARSDIHANIAQAFKYDVLILASPTYNSTLFPHMETFLTGLIERNFQKRSICIIESGTWAPVAGKLIEQKLSHQKNLNYLQAPLTIKAALRAEDLIAIEKMAKVVARRKAR